MVRVAGLMGQAASGLAVRSPDGRTPQEALAEIRERVLALTRRQSRLWAGARARRSRRRGSSSAGRGLSKKELEELEQRFEREIFPVLTPLAVGPGQPFPYISALSLWLGVLVRDPRAARSGSRA